MPAFTTLIDASALLELIGAASPCVLLDCRFDLADTTAGERAFREGHIPGARYAHLDRDLSSPRHPDGPRSSAFTGRHPLPSREAFAQQAGRWGIAPGVQVVAYDGQGGMYAARAWWMLRWMGHAEAAVLDGGLAAWTALGGRLEAGDAPAPLVAPAYPLSAGVAMPSVDVSALERRIGQSRVIDARTVERWRGESETLDPVGGHIPGSVPRFFRDNLGPDGRFRSPQELREAFAALGVTRGEGVVHQCGSGVTACVNLLAMEHAGLAGSSLYPGSWSEWCADERRPVARG